MLESTESDILKNLFGNEYEVLVSNIINVFDNYDYVAYIDEFQTFIFSLDDTNADIQNNINNLLAFHLYRIGSMVGIVFNGESSLTDRYLIMEAIDTISNLDDGIKENMQDIVMQDTDSVEILRQLIDYVGHTEIDVLEIVEDVKPTLIDNLKTLMFKTLNNDEDIVDMTTIIKKEFIYKDIFDKMPNPNFFTYVKNTQNHLEIEILVILFKELLQKYVGDQLIEFVTALILFSNTNPEEYEEVFYKVFPNYIPEYEYKKCEKQIISILQQMKDVK